MSKKIVRYFFACICLSGITSAFAYSNADCLVVDSLANRGIVSYRTSCSEYNLDRNISRQEVAAVALKVAETCGTIQNIPPIGQYSCTGVFNDVTTGYQNDWACRAVETLANRGIISKNDSYFRPLQSITRAEALSIMLDSAGLNFRSTNYDDWRFASTGAVNWQKPVMQYAYDNGIISSINSYSPNLSAYRNEIFNYAKKAIDLCGSSYNNNNTYNYGNCSVGQYSSGNSCYSCTGAPWNGYYTTANSCNWTCNSGYYKSGNTCVANNGYNNTQCGLGQYWLNNTCYSCLSAPSNAYYTTSGTCDWTCNSGYYKSGSTCVSNYNYNNNGTCTVGQYWSGNTCNTCGSAPSNAYYTTQGTCDWTCNSGFYKSNGVCVANNNYYNNNNCGIGQYYSGNTCYSCGVAPSNGYYNTSGSCTVTCYSGYYYNSSTNACVSNYNNNYNSCGVGQYWAGSTCVSCYTKPSSAYYTTANSCDWMCSSGYYKSGNTCVSNYNNSCGTGQYFSNGICYSCGTAPVNGYYATTNSCTVTCYSGYYYNSSTNTCVSSYNNNYNTCGVGQYYSNGTCYSCGTAPYNGYYSTANSCTVTCYSGYYYNSSTNTCVSSYNNNYNTCGTGQYWSGSSCYSCGTAPVNGYYATTNSCTVTCYSGYYYNSSTNTCVSNYNNNYNNNGTCGIGQYTTTYGIQTCNTKPSNSYYTTAGSCAWACNAGYLQIGNMCVWY